MKKTTHFISRLAFVLIFGFVFLSEAHAQPFDVQKAIASGDHKGLAEFYKSQAAADRAVAEKHRMMKTEYRRTHVHYKGIENVLAGHCGNLSYDALKMAEQYEAMAKEEERLAAGK